MAPGFWLQWASNLAAGSDYGYRLLWMVTLSTIMLIILQHNAAHLGIVTGDCLAEAASKHIRPPAAKIILSTAVLASVSTAMAEILGGAIALQLLFKIPLKIGSIIVLAFVLWMLFSNSYKHLEKWIIGFVSIDKIILWIIGIVVSILNIMLLVSFL